MKSFLSVVIAAMFSAFIAIPEPVSGNNLSLTYESVEDIRRLYADMDNLSPEDPLHDARKMQLLMLIKRIHDHAISFDQGRSDLGRALQLTPKRVVPQLALPIDLQVDRHTAKIRQNVIRCLERPTAECLFVSATAAAVREPRADQAQSMLTMALWLAADHDVLDALTPTVHEMFSMMLRMTTPGNGYPREGWRSHIHVTATYLFYGGYEHDAFSLVRLPQAFDEKHFYDNPALLAVYYVQRYRNARASVEDVENRVNQAAQESNRPTPMYAAAPVIVRFLTQVEALGNIPGWIGQWRNAARELNDISLSTMAAAQVGWFGYPDEARAFLPVDWKEREFAEWTIPAFADGLRAASASGIGDTRLATDFAKRTLAHVAQDMSAKPETTTDYFWMMQSVALLMAMKAGLMQR